MVSPTARNTASAQKQNMLQAKIKQNTPKIRRALNTTIDFRQDKHWTEMPKNLQLICPQFIYKMLCQIETLLIRLRTWEFSRDSYLVDK